MENMEEELSEDTQNSEFTHDNCNDKAILSNEDEHVLLYTGKRFELWDDCEDFNPEGFVIINKIVDQHNHLLNVSMIEFEDSRKFTNLMLEDIKFMTMSCKFGATVQRKFLEGKYPTHPVYSQELYKAIQKFRPTKNSLSSDATDISNWLDSQKEADSRWIVYRGWDEDNTLTHLLWMTPSQVENWRLLNNSNIPLYDLMFEIQRLLDQQDKEKEYEYWRLSIPNIRRQTNTNFLFTKIDQNMQEFLTPTILKMHRDEMNQSLYYVANQINQNVDMHEERTSEVAIEQISSDIPKATLNQMMEFVGSHNVREIWAVNVGNLLDIKHYILLLHNRGICARVFQLYNVASFVDITFSLCLFNQNNNVFCEEQLTILEQKLIYGKLHGMYKKALNKALQSNSKSEQLISLLQEFTEDGESDLDELNEID
ncbi:unnamed protein product [Rhizophagus irregularis]|nr:unnamed protein product [Rhizophagus irregularis]